MPPIGFIELAIKVTSFISIEKKKINENLNSQVVTGIQSYQSI